MDTKEEEPKGLKSFLFTGKKEDYMMWQAKFVSYANFKNFKDVLTGKKKLIIMEWETELTATI